jgi:hypothetical protein
MGYNTVLQRNPRRSITWKQSSSAERKFGRDVGEATREVRLTIADQLATRLHRDSRAPRVGHRLWDLFRNAVLVLLAVFLVTRLTKG